MKTIINIDLKKITNPVYLPLHKNTSRYLVLYGGAGSGKSWFAAEKILLRVMKEPGHRILVIRKIARTIRRSCFQLLQDYISRWNINSLFIVNKSEMNITFKYNGNMILFAGIDDPEKLKSIERITSIWVEEATELSLDDFFEIDRRLRGNTKYYKQIILSFNPILKSNWTYKRFFDKLTREAQKDITTLKTTYKDNEFIINDLAYVRLLEGYTGNNRKVYTLGQYGLLENAIYTNWRMIDDADFPTTDEPILGLDFGFIAPMALVKMVVDMEARKVYLHELYYQTRKTTKDFVEDIEELDLKNFRIIADSEAPDKIKEMNDYGYGYIEGANKNKGSVIAGIDFINQFELLITKSSTNIKREIEGYQRRQDKDGNIMEEPEKGVDHSMDAVRYPMYTIFYTEGIPYFYVAGQAEEKNVDNP